MSKWQQLREYVCPELREARHLQITSQVERAALNRLVSSVWWWVFFVGCVWALVWIIHDRAWWIGYVVAIPYGLLFGVIGVMLFRNTIRGAMRKVIEDSKTRSDD